MEEKQKCNQVCLQTPEDKEKCKNGTKLFCQKNFESFAKTEGEKEGGKVDDSLLHWILTCFAGYQNRNVYDFIKEHKQDVENFKEEINQLITSSVQQAVEKERERITREIKDKLPSLRFGSVSERLMKIVKVK